MIVLTYLLIFFLYAPVANSVVVNTAWAPTRFFPWVGNEGRKSPSRVQGQPPVGVWGKAPRSWRHFLKMMPKYFVHWNFRQHLQQKKHFSTFPGRGGASAPLPMPAGAHGCTNVSVQPSADIAVAVGVYSASQRLTVIVCAFGGNSRQQTANIETRRSVSDILRWSVNR